MPVGNKASNPIAAVASWIMNQINEKFVLLWKDIGSGYWVYARTLPPSKKKCRTKIV